MYYNDLLSLQISKIVLGREHMYLLTWLALGGFCLLGWPRSPVALQGDLNAIEQTELATVHPRIKTSSTTVWSDQVMNTTRSTEYRPTMIKSVMIHPSAQYDHWLCVTEKHPLFYIPRSLDFKAWAHETNSRIVTISSDCGRAYGIIRYTNF